MRWAKQESGGAEKKGECWDRVELQIYESDEKKGGLDWIEGESNRVGEQGKVRPKDESKSVFGEKSGETAGGWPLWLPPKSRMLSGRARVN